MSELMCSQSKCRRKDEHIAELETRELGFIQSLCELGQENAKLRGLMSEALSNMEYYPASLGEYWLVQDSDITAMQEALQERGE